MAATYEPIATTTLGSAAASVTFSAISGSFTDLILVCNYGTSTNANEAVYVQFNSDTGNNYSQTDLYGTGPTSGSQRITNTGFIRIGGRVSGTASGFENISICHIQNYSNSTTNKTLLNRYGAASLSTTATVGLWRNTNAITTILIAGASQNLNTGSTFTLYGIKAAI